MNQTLHELKSVSDVSDQAYDESGPGQDFRSCRLSVCPNATDAMTLQTR